MSQKRKTAYLYLFASAAIWGLAGPIIKFTLGGLEPLFFLTYRFSISAIISLFFVLTQKTSKHESKSLLKIILYGFIAYYGAIGLLFLGLNYATVLDLSVVSVIEPLIVLFGGALFFHDKVTKKEKKGALIAVLGTTSALVLPVVYSGKYNNSLLVGALFLIGFMILDAGGILYSKKLMRGKISPLFLTNIGMITAGVLFVLTTVAMGNSADFVASISTLPLSYHLGVWYMALVSGSLGYYFFTRGTRTIEVSEAGLFYYLQIVFQIPLAIFWLHEPVTPLYLLGALLVAIGVYIAEKK